MNKVERPRVNNGRVLKTLAGIEPNIGDLEAQLRAKHRVYFSNERDPAALRPLGLTDEAADWLRERYASARVGDGLGWIKSLREDHGLVCCPMCGGTGVIDLDHVLPKADYPEFAVFSFNLVPTCTACNRRRSNKGNRFHFVHPYFDTALLERLRLIVVFQPPYDVARFTLASTGVTGSDLERVARQLEETLPVKAFRRSARRHWVDWHKRFHRRGQAQALVRLLEDLEDAEASSINSWEAAFLRGLSRDTLVQNWMATNRIPTETAALA